VGECDELGEIGEEQNVVVRIGIPSVWTWSSQAKDLEFVDVWRMGAGEKEVGVAPVE